MRRIYFLTTIVCLGAVLDCAPEVEVPIPPMDLAKVDSQTLEVRPIGRSIDPPAGMTAVAPNLALVGDGVALSWLESSGTEGAETVHRLLMSRLQGEQWTEPTTIAEGSDFFANWADIPGVIEASHGSLYAHWLAKTADDTYAYSIYLGHSSDDGATWQRIGRLNDDDTPTEHGFVTYVREGGGIRAFWLDGRAMMEDGPMAIRTALIEGSVGAAQVLDERVCECCSTDSALTTNGPLVVFRDRSEQEVRDVGVVRRDNQGWSGTVHVNNDNWVIPGCPVNGPEVASAGASVALAWFTAAEDEPQVRIAFSSDSGSEFGLPILVDGDGPLGRVDVVLESPGQAVISWLTVVDERAQLRLRRAASTGMIGEAVAIATTNASRSSGVPRMIATNNKIYVVWVEVLDSEESRIHMREIEPEELPEITG